MLDPIFTAGLLCGLLLTLALAGLCLPPYHRALRCRVREATFDEITALVQARRLQRLRGDEGL